MKRWIYLISSFITAAVISVSMMGGCHRTLASPTFPSTATPIPTNTIALTATPTGTPTSTLTLSPTFTPTATGQATATNTPTATITNSATASPTNTITNTPAPSTPTPTVCSAASIQATYTFATSSDCWHGDAGTTIVQSYGLSTAHVYTGSTNSFAVSVHNGAASNQNAQLEVTYASPQNLSSAVISMWVYVDATLANTCYNSGAQPFAQGPWTSNYFNVCGSTNTGTWFNAAVTLGSGATTITQFGLQLTGVPAGASGNIYIDAVTITIPTVPTATPTSTATAAVSYFEGSNNSLSGWSDIPSGAATLTPLQLFSPGYGASVSACGVSVTWSAINQTVDIQYSYGTYTNWTSLGITGFRAWTYSNPEHSTAGGLQPYCQSGSTYAWENGSWTNASSSWQQINWAPPFSASGSSPVSVDQFGIQFSTGGTAGTFSTDAIEIGNVEMY